MCFFIHRVRVTVCAQCATVMAADLLEKADLEDGDLEVKVSTVLNRQVREYGKRFMFDGREDTCWNSDQGSPQWIRLQFEAEVRVDQVEFMFQGGFAGKTCWLEASTSADAGSQLEKVADFYPEDINKLQKFPLPAPVKAKAFRVVFADSTDFFGRITVYQMKLIAAK